VSCFIDPDPGEIIVNSGGINSLPILDGKLISPFWMKVSTGDRALVVAKRPPGLMTDKTIPIWTLLANGRLVFTLELHHKEWRKLT